MSKSILHVVPEHDLIEHETEGLNCPCCPRIEDGLDYRIVIHDAADGRD